MNVRTRPVTKEELFEIVNMLVEGFEYKGQMVKSKDKIAAVVLSEANLGIRLSDVLHLTLESFQKDGGVYYIDIVEQKTGKRRHLPVSSEFMNYIQAYAIRYKLNTKQRLFDFTDRYVQKYLRMVCYKLGYHNVSTHSLRKFYGTEIYKDNNYDIRLVQVLLNHSDVRVTQKYIGVDSQKIDTAINSHVVLF